jgi:hypothetical protein
LLSGSSKTVYAHSGLFCRLRFYARQSDKFLDSANFSTQQHASKDNPLLTPEMKPLCLTEVLLTPSLKITLFIFTAIYTLNLTPFLIASYATTSKHNPPQPNVTPAVPKT